VARTFGPAVVLSSLVACILVSGACGGAGQGEPGGGVGRSCQAAGGICLPANSPPPPNYQPASPGVECEDPSLACWQQIGAEPTPCFSPSQTPELGLDEPDAGCACDDDEGVCVPTTYQGRAWNVALICVDGRWHSVEDGPCAPTVPSGAGCVVEGQRYADGATVPDPYSCNSCQCEDGAVTACTEIGCSEACPEGTAPGTSCAACGPTDACEAVETTCLLSCQSDDDCTDSAHFACIDGQCRNVCG